MACLLTSGYSESGCGFLLGGLKTLYIANHEDVASILDTTTPTPDGILDAITMNGAAVFYKFDFERDTASFSQELQKSNGNTYVMQTVTFSLQGQGNTVKTALTELSLGKVMVIAESRTGIRSVLGYEIPLEAAAGTNQNSGAAAGDFGGAVITLVTEVPGWAPELDGTTVIPV